MLLIHREADLFGLDAEIFVKHYIRYLRSQYTKNLTSFQGRENPLDVLEESTMNYRAASSKAVTKGKW